jgi:uncharacterized protein (TIGR02302 family)
VKQNRSALSSAAAQSRLRRLTLLAWAALLIERLMRALLPAVIVTGLFVAVSWTGLWLGASGVARLSGTVVFIGLLLAALSPLRHFAIPGVADARAALDAQSAEAPAAALADALANKGDPQTLGLWRLHLRRAEKNAAGLRPVRPAPKLWILDRFALGALVVLALAASAFMAGPEKYARFAAAFDWRLNAAENAPSRIDAWIDPPGYTGKPPVVLPLAPSDAMAPITAPIGSTIVVRAMDNADVRIVTQGGVKAAAPAPGATPNQQRLLLQGDGSLRISRGAKEVGAFSLLSLPDAPPTITPLGPPQPNLRGSFTLAYQIADDYGARDAQASALLPADGQSPTPEGHALVEPPKGALELAAAPGGLGEARSTLDWSDSPYAGARVDLILQVRDEGGNEGQAVISGFMLPQKNLANPLARALAEQRRLLALDSGQRDKVLTAIDALMIAPELFTPKASVFLGLRFVHASLRHARTDADLVAVTDLLWELALHIEEGDAPQAERDLRAAQKALREALNRGASPEEIERLTQQLQKALDAFLAEMAKNSAQKAQSGESETGDSRTVTPKDLKSMLDQLSEAAKNGDKEAAMELLERMQDMLENLRSAEKSRESGQAARNRKAMRDIDKLMRDQQKLRDDTFAHQRSEQSESDSTPPQAGVEGKKQQGAGRQGAPSARPKSQGGQAGAEQDESSGSQSDASQPRQLDRRQKQLRDQLESLQKRAGPPGGEGPKGLGEADDAMKQAEQALRKGDDDGAMEAQARALEGLRKGAGEMAAQAQQGSPGDNEGEGQPDEKNGGMRGQNGEGPFGQSSRRNNVDATAAQKARKVLEELRRRLSDPNRGRDELDYLERLIKPD